MCLGLVARKQERNGSAPAEDAEEADAMEE